MNSVQPRKEETGLVKPPSKYISPFEEMERLFENFSTRGWLRPFQWETPLLNELVTTAERKIPSVDVVDRDNDILVKAELPGIDKKDLDISVTSNSVTIKGETSHEEKEEKGNYYRCEISKGSYSRSIGLPSEVDEKASKAKFKDGLLEITLPKLKKTKHHNIKVE